MSGYGPSSFISSRALTYDDEKALTFMRFCLGTEGLLSKRRKKKARRIGSDDDDDDDESWKGDDDSGGGKGKKKKKGKEAASPSKTDSGSKKRSKSGARTAKGPGLDHLPDDVLLLIFEYLDPIPTLVRLTSVCRGLRRLLTSADASSLWEDLDFSNYGSLAPSKIALLMKTHRQSWTQVKTIDLHGCGHINDDVLRKLVAAYGRTLEVLSLTQCAKITKNAFIELQASIVGGGLPVLHTLRLAMLKNINDAFVQALARSEFGTRMRCLDLCGSAGLSNAAMKDVVIRCTALEHLDLSGRAINTVLMDNIMKNLKALKVLSLRQCRLEDSKPPNAKIPAGHGLPELTELDLSGSVEPGSGHFILSILATSPKLASLDLGELKSPIRTMPANPVPYCLRRFRVRGSASKLDDELIIALAGPHANMLEDLDVGACTHLGQKFFSFVATGCGSLTTLILSGTTVTEEQLSLIVEGNPRLKWLALDSCRSLPRNVRTKTAAQLSLRAGDYDDEGDDIPLHQLAARIR